MPAAISGQSDRVVRRRILISLVPAVLYPFECISVHLVDTPGVRLEHIGRNGLLAILPLCAVTIGGIAVVVGLIGRNRRAPPERSFATSPRNIFPFRFAQQAVELAGLL